MMTPVNDCQDRINAGTGTSYSQHLAGRFTVPRCATLSRVDRVAEGMQTVASLMIAELPESPELNEGLHQLLKAREQFILAALG